jgi:hypothetical protein
MEVMPFCGQKHIRINVLYNKITEKIHNLNGIR